MGGINKKLLISLIVAFTLFSPTAYANNGACNIAADWITLETSDMDRISNLHNSRTKGLSAALRSANQADREIVARIFENDFIKINDANEIAGKYQCRTIKLGGLDTITIYKWFKCEIWAEGKALLVKKTTGSQNFMGILNANEAGLNYSGALSYGYEKIYKMYGEDKERNQVGCLNAIDKSLEHFILELPEPKVESFHDIIEFEKID